MNQHALTACGMEWQPDCLRFHQLSRPIRTASLTQVRQPLYRHSVERWRNYLPALQELFTQLEQLRDVTFAEGSLASGGPGLNREAERTGEE